MRAITIAIWFLAAVPLLPASSSVLAWGGLGHRIVATIALQLLPPEKVQAMNAMLVQLEMDGDFVDAASYPDEWVRNHDPGHQFGPWHFADLPDDGSSFHCGNCLLKELPVNLAIVRNGETRPG
jgi:hypothetical protein